ncbi:MAG: hypothetical protein IKD02_04630 [Clostridia bacterium]|nr:hypothetical protein [Clostridia bacterium]
MAYRQYGHFDEATSDFIITNPDIPRNWYNYLWNERYVTFTSQTGAGNGFVQDRLSVRQSMVEDRGVFLVEDGKSVGLCGLPVKEKRDSYRCVHRRGETTVYTEQDGIASEFCIFVPRKEPCEIWTLKLKNNSDRTRKLTSLFFFGSTLDGPYTRQGYNHDTSCFDEELNAVVKTRKKTFDGEKRTLLGMMMMAEPADGFDCTYNSIIGPYGSFAHPVIAERGHCTSQIGNCEKLAYALQKNVTLAPGEEHTVILICGFAFSREEAIALRQKYATPKAVEAEKQAVLDTFVRETGNVSINTPDKELNHLFPWLKHQTHLGSFWARVRSTGYRDITQDSECMASICPEKALERLTRILSFQYPSGYAPRRVANGKMEDMDFSDNAVWISMAVLAVVKELGKKELLDLEVPFNDGSVGTLYDHAYRAVDFLYHFRGMHDLIRIWGGDWNDCMNTAGLEGKGVSVWLSIAWCHACRALAELALIHGRQEDHDEALRRYAEMRDLINRHGWDGEYYIDAYNDDGDKLGSHLCEEGAMFLIPQLWAVISGIGVDGRELIAMQSVEEKLSTPLGTRIMYPSYVTPNDRIGVITTKPAGVQENGGVYLHAIAWKLITDALLKRPEKVEEDLITILPFRNPVVAGRAEPYILCNSYFQIETGPRYGTAGQSWRTATGQQVQRALINYVFGLKPEMEGLRIDPCLPPSWKTCSVTKEFRGCVYRIHYRNGGANVKSILVNGKPLEGSILPLLSGEVEVEVVTG